MPPVFVWNLRADKHCTVLARSDTNPTEWARLKRVEPRNTAVFGVWLTGRSVECPKLEKNRKGRAMSRIRETHQRPERSNRRGMLKQTAGAAVLAMTAFS